MKLKLTINHLIELILPRQCISCKAPGHDLCPACRIKIIIASQFCPLCFKRSRLGFVCHHCRQHKTQANFTAICVYSNSEQKLIMRCLDCLRNKGQRNIAHILGKLMSIKFMQEWPKKYPRPDLIIPWPITKLEERQRGYQQNLYLAQGFNTNNKFTILQNSFRVRNRKNHAFSWRGGALNKENVILISDYLASDKLIDLAAKVLKDAGAKQVLFIALSRKL